jgi:DNA (cytosine-5)-methyltransferase 1
MKSTMFLGSLFDGSGGFPLGGIIAGMTPVWSSEIEPFPIRVTEKRLPSVRHYGDVSKLNGADLEPVDVITFGSPCQDMSLAGKRAGLDGARSGLFFQAVRIIKEMRAKYGRPRFAVWENVRGALSSAGGEDFRRVLEELCRVKDDAADVPRPKKWQSAGLIWGNGYSVAWRVLDAQYWGVPQRRKRVYLVADFDGDSAGKVLFESEGMSGHSEKMRAARKDFARTAQNGAGETGSGAGTHVLNDQGGSSISVENDLSPTLRAEAHQHLPIVYGLCSYESNSMKSSNPYSGIYKADTARTLDINGGSPACDQGGMLVLFDNHRSDARYTGPCDASPTITSHLGTGGLNAPLVTTDYKSPPVVNADWRVRMITPLECARLQGFPDWWTDCLTDENPSDEEVRKWQGIFDEYCDINGKKRKTASQVRKWLMTEPTDAAKYKMWGNGVALPCVVFVLAGIMWEVNNANKQAGA